MKSGRHQPGGSDDVKSAGARQACRVPPAWLRSCCAGISSVLLALALPVPPAIAATSHLTIDSLRQDLAAQIGHGDLSRAQLGVKVRDLKSGRTVFEHQAGKLFKPASNAKLFTGAFALDRLGPEFRIQTSVYASAKPDATGGLPGDLILYGRGDPSFSDRFPGGTKAALERLAGTIAGVGVRQIAGDLVADESYFRVARFGANWAWEDMEEAYGAEISSLSVFDNVARLRVAPGHQAAAECRLFYHPEPFPLRVEARLITVAAGQAETFREHRPLLGNTLHLTGSLALGGNGRTLTLPVHRPAQWFGELLSRALADRGVRIGGRVRAMNWEERAREPLATAQLVHLAAAASPPLLDLARVMMKESQNLHAQLLLLQAGMKSAQPGDDAEAAGVRELMRFIEQAGIPRADVELNDGAGLSRSALVTPDAITGLLAHMAGHPAAAAYESTFTVAGVDGTLANRFKGTVAEGNLRGKTGTIRHVIALSGHVTTRGGEQWLFSILLNNFGGGTTRGREIVDELALTLAEFRGRLEP